MTNSIENWLETHAEQLRLLADRLDTDPDLPRFLAGLVLAGLSDDEIFDHVRTTLPSWDGQENPLARVADALHEVREAIAAS
ncbi:MAG TPA: hypothetical protein VF152_01200 [Acidimicrobiia bacterium]